MERAQKLMEKVWILERIHALYQAREVLLEMGPNKPYVPNETIQELNKAYDNLEDAFMIAAEAEAKCLLQVGDFEQAAIAIHNISDEEKEQLFKEAEKARIAVFENQKNLK